MVSRRRRSMVKARTIALMLALLPLTAVAQHYYITDTVTEHNNFGTFYHDRFEGRKTASGEVFDQNKFTAAHWKIKLGTLVMVTNRNTGLQVIVKVNDRCPKHNVLDMSHRAANAIGIKGCQKVTVRILPEGYEERWAAQETMFDSVRSRLTDKQAPKQPTTKAQEAPIAEIKTVTGKKELEKPTATKPPTVKHRSQEYNLVLASETTHSEAFNSINKLPKVYQNKVIVEPLDDSSHVKITLDVRLPEQKAKNLKAALRHSFPDITMTLCE